MRPKIHCHKKKNVIELSNQGYVYKNRWNIFFSNQCFKVAWKLFSFHSFMKSPTYGFFFFFAKLQKSFYFVFQLFSTPRLWIKRSPWNKCKYLRLKTFPMVIIFAKSMSRGLFLKIRLTFFSKINQNNATSGSTV